MNLVLAVLCVVTLACLVVAAWLQFTYVNMSSMPPGDFDEMLEVCAGSTPAPKDLHKYRMFGLMVYCDNPPAVADSIWATDIYGVAPQEGLKLQLEGGKVDGLYVFETDEDRYFHFVGTKLMPTFLKEAISTTLRECTVNQVRMVDLFADLYETYYPLIRKFLEEYVTRPLRNHLSGHSLGAVVSHMFYRDFRDTYPITTHYTIGCPRVISGTTYLDSICVNYTVGGDSIPVFYDQIVHGEPTLTPGEIEYLNFNSGSWAVNHSPLYYTWCMLQKAQTV